MAIDGVGKKGPIVPALPAGQGGPPNVSSPTRAFDLEPAHAVVPAGEVHAPALTALDQLRAGAITPSEYVDLKVEQATSHLTTLPPAELESVRSALRDRIASDPALSDLVRAATGATPPLPRDE
jgi:hypothetical protein